MASKSSSSRDTRELEEAKKEESCEQALPVEAEEMGNSQINDESLETSESPSSSRTASEDPEDWSLSASHCPATSVVLQDCGTEHSSRLCPRGSACCRFPGLQGLPGQLQD